MPNVYNRDMKIWVISVENPGFFPYAFVNFLGMGANTTFCLIFQKKFLKKSLEIEKKTLVRGGNCLLDNLPATRFI